MTTFQNIIISKYIDNWMGYSGTPPSDLPQTLTGLGSITTQTLSFSDNDRVEVIHRVPVYHGIYDYPAEKILRIQFTTPNDGISHSYNTDVVASLVNPPAYYFDMTSALEYYSGGFWLTFLSTGFFSTSSIGASSEPGIFDASYGYGHFYINGAVLTPNTDYRLSCQCDNSILGVYLGKYFDYSVVMSVFCADFSGGITTPNLCQMIIEQN